MQSSASVPHIRDNEERASRPSTIHWIDDASDPSCYQLAIGDDCLSLSDFLLKCAKSLDWKDVSSASARTRDFLHLRNLFLQGGLAQLCSLSSSPEWIQVGIQGAGKQAYQDLYSRVRCLVRGLMDRAVISNFFFMHKPPGLRLRFETNAPGQTLVPDELYQQKTLLRQLSPRARELVSRYRQSLGAETARWCTDYFWTPEASIGPREAAAFFTIFHWNRAGLSIMRQSLLTEALASRKGL